MSTRPRDLTRALSLLTAAAVAGLSGCGAGLRPSAAVAGHGRGAISLAAAMSPASSPRGNALAVAHDEQGFALSLLRRLGPSSPNLVMSPSSLATLLAMVEPGAAGPTQDGIAQTLQSAGLSASDQAGGWGALDATIAGQVSADQIVLDTANQAWFQTGLPVRPSYVGLLGADFHTGVHETDIEGDPAAAAHTINAWVGSHTGGHINQLVTPVELADVVALLVDAVYMKASWANRFDAAETAPAPFHVAPTMTVHVPTMEGSFEAPASVSSSLDAAELGYQGDDLSALVLMPPVGQLAAFERELTPAGLALIVGGLRPQPVNVRMPRFSVGSALSLKHVLSAMGMSQAFTNGADFSNLSPQPLQLSFVVQDAQMKVNENGTEASAASAAGVTPTAVRRPRPELNLVFDHPFLFLVRDNSTGLIIFATQVDNPAT